MIKCSKCNKEMQGVITGYQFTLLCGKCAKDNDAIHSERGSKVKVVDINNGYDYDAMHAQKYLKLGETYTVDSIEIGGWCSYITLVEMPYKKFNSVHFKLIKDKFKR